MKSPEKPLAMKNDHWVQEGQNLTLQCWAKDIARIAVRAEWKFYPHCKHREVEIYMGKNYNYLASWNVDSSALNFSLLLYNISTVMIGCYDCCLNVTYTVFQLLPLGAPRSACTRIRVLKSHNGKFYKITQVIAILAI